MNFLDTFKTSFAEFENKNIVLYGIGVKTQSILENINFNFIGLMDKDTENIGKTYYGLKVLSYEEVIKSADLIIIVAGDVYFQTIFSRIEFLQKEHDIPIYFCDGTQGKIYEKDNSVLENPYWQKIYDSLIAEIDNNEIISFDVFDTLITRKITEPVDLFSIIQKKIGNNCDFAQKRIKTEIELGNFATLKKIYENLPMEYANIYFLEKELELAYSMPRFDMVKAFNYAVNQKKDVYLISDIYHDREFLEKLLKKSRIEGYKDILISCELCRRKSDGTLWEYYCNITKNKATLHIGDNLQADIEKAKSYGINTFHVMRPYDILKNSTLKNIVPKICGFQDSVIIGNIISRIFNSPFVLSKTQGQPLFDNLKSIGYVFFAPVLFAFIVWIIKENIKNNTDKILFLARDGYFLEKLYNLLIQKLNIKNAPKGQYLMISRALITILNLKNDKDIEDALKIRFYGKMKAYLKIRFGIDVESEEFINTSFDMEKIKEFVNSNKTQILENAEEQRNLYLKYINSLVDSEDNIAIVDPSYNGTNQYFLSRLLNKKIKGYYCNANLSKDNNYFFGDNMFALFQSKDDLEAKNSNLRKNTQFFEDGILVAPTGICLKINSDMSFEFSEKGNTQKNFTDKEKVFEGVVEFFNDALINCNDLNDIEISPSFIDFIIGEIYSKNTAIIKEIKDTFFVDTMYETIYDRKMFEE